MHLSVPPWFTELFALLLAGRDLPFAKFTMAMRDLVAGRVDEARGAAFLTALRLKGESAEEIAAAALVLREQMVRLVPVSGPVLDTCGTGGDESGTFNISTAAALVAAGAGVPVVKHGNRAVSSRSGQRRCAPRTGRAGRARLRVGPEVARPHRLRLLLRSALPRRHGPRRRAAQEAWGPDDLQPPRSARQPRERPYQLLGVGKPELLDPLAGAIAELGTRRAVLVCSRDGLDEVSLAAPTMVRVVQGREYEAREWQPEEFGLAPVSLESIRVSGPAESAAIIRSVLEGKESPAQRIVLANAAAALWAAEAVTTLREGVELAAEAIKSGKPRAVLEQLAMG